MKNVVLIFSVIISLIYLFVSQFVYSLIASYFDWVPGDVAAIIVPVVTVLLLILTCVITKEKAIRLRVLIPIVIAFLASVIIPYIRFEDERYINGYWCKYGGSDLYNSLGIKFIDGISHAWYIGADESCNEVIVNIGWEQDRDYENESEKKYDYEIRCYSLSGLFLGSEEFAKYYDKGENKKLFKNYSIILLSITLQHASCTIASAVSALNS